MSVWRHLFLVGEFNAAGGGDEFFCHAFSQAFIIYDFLFYLRFLVKVDAKPM